MTPRRRGFLLGAGAMLAPGAAVVLASHPDWGWPWWAAFPAIVALALAFVYCWAEGLK
jgi:hypothetical protein